MSNERAEENVSQQNPLEQTLKRCRPEVVKAAVEYQKSRDAKLLPMIVVGVFERFVEPERRGVLQAADVSEVKLQTDLGLDSLMMVEVVMTFEEILGQQIPDTELRGLYTIGDTLAYVNAKATGGTLPTPPDRLVAEMVPMMLGSQTPLVCDVVLREARVEALYSGSEAVSAQSLIKAAEQMAFLWSQRRNEPAPKFSPKLTVQNITVQATTPVQLRAEKTASGWQIFCSQTGKPAVLLGTI